MELLHNATTGRNSELGLFADDCVCYCEIKNSEDTVKLQEVLGKELGHKVSAGQMQITRKWIKKIDASYTL